MKPEVTKESIRTHLIYSSWKYLLVIVGVIVFWNLIYTTTRYQPPDEKKIEWYYQDVLANEEQINQWLEGIRQESFPDMELFEITSVGTDETYGDMQIMVWMAAAQGDLYQLNTTKFKELAESEAFINLQPYIDDQTLPVEGFKLYYTKDENGVRYPAGIYTDPLKGLEKIGLNGEGKVMGILCTGGNTENTLRFMKLLMETMIPESK